MSARRTQTVDDVKATLGKIKKVDARDAMARAMLKYGNLDNEAIAHVLQYLDHARQCSAYNVVRK